MFPVRFVEPLKTILGLEPGEPLNEVTETPATFPVNEEDTEACGAWVSVLLSNFATEIDNFFLEVPDATPAMITSSNTFVDGSRLTSNEKL